MKPVLTTLFTVKMKVPDFLIVGDWKLTVPLVPVVPLAPATGARTEPQPEESPA